MHCKLKQTLLICDLKPALNENAGSDKRFLFLLGFVMFSFVMFSQAEVCLGTSLSFYI